MYVLARRKVPANCSSSYNSEENDCAYFYDRNTLTRTRTPTRTHTHTPTHTHSNIQTRVTTAIILENGEYVSKSLYGQSIPIEGRSQHNLTIDTMT